MDYRIRELKPEDNRRIEYIIRTCLVEFGADHAGTAWADPDLGRFSEVYNEEESQYWVAENVRGEVIGGVRIGRIDSVAGVCELQKMYCLPEARGTGAAHALMKTALAYARKHYCRCYLETLENMVAAQKFYEKYGFRRIAEPLVETGHYACDVRYSKEWGTETCLR